MQRNLDLKSTPKMPITPLDLTHPSSPKAKSPRRRKSPRVKSPRSPKSPKYIPKSPPSEKKKITYSRSFILNLANAPLSLQRPSFLNFNQKLESLPIYTVALHDPAVVTVKRSAPPGFDKSRRLSIREIDNNEGRAWLEGLNDKASKDGKGSKGERGSGSTNWRNRAPSQKNKFEQTLEARYADNAEPEWANVDVKEDVAFELGAKKFDREADLEQMQRLGIRPIRRESEASQEEDIFGRLSRRVDAEEMAKEKEQFRKQMAVEEEKHEEEELLDTNIEIDPALLVESELDKMDDLLAAKAKASKNQPNEDDEVEQTEVINHEKNQFNEPENHTPMTAPQTPLQLTIPKTPPRVLQNPLFPGNDASFASAFQDNWNYGTKEDELRALWDQPPKPIASSNPMTQGQIKPEVFFNMFGSPPQPPQSRQLTPQQQQEASFARLMAKAKARKSIQVPGPDAAFYAPYQPPPYSGAQLYTRSNAPTPLQRPSAPYPQQYPQQSIYPAAAGGYGPQFAPPTRNPMAFQPPMRPYGSNFYPPSFDPYQQMTQRPSMQQTPLNTNYGLDGIAWFKSLQNQQNQMQQHKR